MRHLIAAGIALSVASVAAAHHSYTEFDEQRIVEIEGTLVALAWQNPHARLEVQTSGASGARITIESPGVNGMRRRGVPLEALQVGDTVKVAGWPSRRAPDRMYGTNMLADGVELVAQGGVARRWSTEADASIRRAAPALGPPIAPTLFRVWSSDPALDPRTRTGFLTRAVVSLTERGQRALASFDPVSQSTTDGCRPKGMPDMMSQPFPMEFVDRGDAIVLQIEEYDASRTIHMSNAVRSDGEPKTRAGVSVGRWEGETLVVETDRLDSPYFNSRGVPLTDAARILERFSVSGDGRVLTYEVTVTDPEIFTQPVKASRVWLARDGEKVLPFDCK